MITLYNKTKSGAIKQWSIEYKDTHVIITWGLKGGKLQSVVEWGKEKNVGKKNHVDQETDALNLFDRKVELKMREGYSEDLAPEDDTVDPLVKLPHNIRFYKPQNSMTSALSKKLTKDKKDIQVVAVRKYDGECFVAHRLEDEVILYSRTMLTSHHLEGICPWTKRFSKIAKELEYLPPGTILTGELISPDRDDNEWYIDGREYVARVLKSLTPQAIELQKEHGELIFMPWDMPFYGGTDMVKVTYVDRMRVLSELGRGSRGKFGNLIGHPKIYVCFDEEGLRPEDWSEMAGNYGWEGLVVRWIGDDTPLYSLTGKVQRSKYCAKLKPEFEDDFIAKWDPDNGEGEWGNGRYTGCFGSASLYQLDSEGNEIFICKCGNGVDEDFIFDNSDFHHWPKVLKVKYNARTYISKGDKTNALQFPRVLEVREDKSIEECINEEL